MEESNTVRLAFGTNTADDPAVAFPSLERIAGSPDGVRAVTATLRAAGIDAAAELLHRAAGIVHLAGPCGTRAKVRRVILAVVVRIREARVAEQGVELVETFVEGASCVFSIFVRLDIIGLFGPALFLHPRIIHPIDS